MTFSVIAIYKVEQFREGDSATTYFLRALLKSNFTVLTSVRFVVSEPSRERSRTSVVLVSLATYHRQYQLRSSVTTETVRYRQANVGS